MSSRRSPMGRGNALGHRKTELAEGPASGEHAAGIKQRLGRGRLVTSDAPFPAREPSTVGPKRSHLGLWRSQDAAPRPHSRCRHTSLREERRPASGRRRTQTGRERTTVNGILDCALPARSGDAGGRGPSRRPLDRRGVLKRWQQPEDAVPDSGFHLLSASRVRRGAHALKRIACRLHTPARKHERANEVRFHTVCPCGSQCKFALPAGDLGQGAEAVDIRHPEYRGNRAPERSGMRADSRGERWTIEWHADC